MVRKCSLPGCNSERQDVIKLHKMPKNIQKRTLWLRVISAVQFAKFDGLDSSGIRKLRICHKHFEQKYVTARARLAYNAFPTLFTAEEIASGIPTRTYAEIETMVNIHKDHTYSRKRHHDHTYSTTKPISNDILTPGTSLTEASPGINQPGSSAAGELCVEQNQGVPQTSRLCSLGRLRRRKIVMSINRLSPYCKKLYGLYRKARKQLDYNIRAKMAMKASKEETFQKLTRSMSAVARKFLWMQIKLCTRNKKARRFSLEEKVIALSIQKQSPKCYRFLQRIFILPSKTTLNKLLGNLNIEAGINQKIFHVIKQEVCDWSDQKKLCTIIFDEMKLDTGLHYMKKYDKINGFVELEEKTCDFADHALTFIIKGAVQKWQQPIAFYFSEGAASGGQVKAIIKEIVTAVTDTGLHPIALVSDQGTSFQSAFKSLQEETRRHQIIAGEAPDDTIQLNGHCLSVVYDPPHLIKGIRNNFLSKNISMDGKTCTWQDMVDVYQTDCRHAQARLLHKLNDEHIIPEKIKKMKVKNCVRVFSKTMAAALSYTASFSHYADGSPVSATLEHTAELVSFLDDLFDSVNGASLHHKATRGKKMRSAVTENSCHHEFWKNSLKTLDNIKFIDKNGKLISVPSLKNWITTIKSYQKLWQCLSKKNIKIMRPRYFNSDAVENFFGRVRSYNARNVDPTCHAFVCTFKSLMMTNLIKFHEKTYNCEDDSTQQIIKIKSLFNSNENNVMDESSRHPSPVPAPPSSSVERGVSISAESIRVQAARERLDVHSRAYTAGWVTRKVLSKYICKTCKKDFTTKETNVHKWISHREYESIKKNKLTYPSVYALRSFGIIVTESNEYLENSAHKAKILKNIKRNLLAKYSFDFIKCDLHQAESLNYFLEVSITLCINNWCNVINKILKGTDVYRLQGRILPHSQAKALEKFRKRLRNKFLYK